MAYYDSIADRWHKITGFKGGSFKEFVLNEKVIAEVEVLDQKVVLEIGAGNGYFMPLLLKKKSGQVPETLIISDASTKNLEIAKKYFKISYAEYIKLDVYKPFPIESGAVDLIISNMVFNEIKRSGLKIAFQELNRILKTRGQFVISVLHPTFIKKQIERKVIKNNKMLGSGGLRIPAWPNSIDDYSHTLTEHGFKFKMQDIFGNEKLYKQKPKLKEISKIPIALLITGQK